MSHTDETVVFVCTHSLSACLQDVSIIAGGSCSYRRLAGERRLQQGVSVDYAAASTGRMRRIVFTYVHCHCVCLLCDLSSPRLYKVRVFPKLQLHGSKDSLFEIYK